VVCCRWKTAAGDWKCRLLVADELGLQEGQTVRVESGEVVVEEIQL
jgi:hypothetical protein